MKERRSYAKRRPKAGISVGALLLLAACAAAGCADRVHEARLVLRAPDAVVCAPSALSLVTARTLGDFPATQSESFVLSAAQPDLAVERFSERGVIGLAVIAEGPGWRGAGWAPFERDATRSLLVLPLAMPCALGDDAVADHPGGAVVARADGSLVLLGGLGADGRSSVRVSVLRAGEQLADIRERELNLRNVAASATALADGRVLVAGGALALAVVPGADSTLDNFEVLDPEASRDAPRLIGRLAALRRDHAAIGLVDGRVLLIGGRAPPELALASAEIVDPRTLDTQLIERAMTRSRVSPVAMRMDDGSIWVAGGLDAANAAMPHVEVVSSDATEWTLAELSLPAPELVVALTNERLLWLWRQDTAVRAAVIVRGRDGMPASYPLSVLMDLATLQGVGATAGGQAIVYGRDAAGDGHAFLVDPGRDRADEIVAASRTATRIVGLADGVVAELASGGAALRRLDERSPFTDPPATLSFREDRNLWLAADAAPRFEEVVLDPALHVREVGARVDVPILRFAHASIVLRVSGPVELLLRRDGSIPLAIVRDAGRVDLAGRCSGVDDGEPLDVEIDAGGITVHAGVEGAPLVCAVEVGARFGISVRARSVETRLSSISIARR